jgi:hypothetical protein
LAAGKANGIQSSYLQKYNKWYIAYGKWYLPTKTCTIVRVNSP